jgi:predicted lipoprotein with Yx(FWY)xxD motif
MGRRILTRVLPLAVLAAIGAGVAVAATATRTGTVNAGATRYGTVLVSAGGRTLYHLTAEKRGKISCTGACAKAWPPLTIEKGSKPKAGAGVKQAKLGTIRRPDGSAQVTYDGLALYRYGDDKKQGDAKGQGEEHVWFTIRPTGALVKTRAAQPATTTTASTTPQAGTTTTPPTTTTHGYGY